MSESLARRSLHLSNLAQFTIYLFRQQLKPRTNEELDTDLEFQSKSIIKVSSSIVASFSVSSDIGVISPRDKAELHKRQIDRHQAI
jgi:hypothetical protein